MAAAAESMMLSKGMGGGGAGMPAMPFGNPMGGAGGSALPEPSQGSHEGGGGGGGGDENRVGETEQQIAETEHKISEDVAGVNETQQEVARSQEEVEKSKQILVKEEGRQVSRAVDQELAQAELRNQAEEYRVRSEIERQKYEAELVQARQQIGLLQNEKANLQSTVANQQENIGRLQATIAEQTRKLDEATSEIQQIAAKDIEAYGRRLQEIMSAARTSYNQSLMDITRQSQSIANQLKNSETRSASLEADLQRLRIQSNSEIQTLRAHNEELQQTLADFSDRCAVSAAESLRNFNLAKTKEIDDLRAVLESALQERDAMQMQVQNAKTEAEQFGKMMTVQQSEIAALQARFNSEVTAMRAEHEAKVQMLQRQNETVRAKTLAQIAVIEGERKRADEAVAALKAQVAKLSESVGPTEAEVRTLKRRLQEEVARAEVLAKQNDDATRALGAIEAQMRESAGVLEAEHLQLQAAFRAKQDEFDSLTRTLQTRLQALAENESMWKEEVRNLTEQRDRAQREADSVRDSLEEQRRLATAVQDRAQSIVESKRREFESQKNQIEKEAADKVKELEAMIDRIADSATVAITENRTDTLKPVLQELQMKRKRIGGDGALDLTGTKFHSTAEILALARGSDAYSSLVEELKAQAQEQADITAAPAGAYEPSTDHDDVDPRQVMVLLLSTLTRKQEVVEEALREAGSTEKRAAEKRDELRKTLTAMEALEREGAEGIARIDRSIAVDSAQIAELEATKESLAARSKDPSVGPDVLKAIKSTVGQLTEKEQKLLGHLSEMHKKRELLESEIDWLRGSIETVSEAVEGADQVHRDATSAREAQAAIGTALEQAQSVVHAGLESTSLGQHAKTLEVFALQAKAASLSAISQALGVRKRIVEVHRDIRGMNERTATFCRMRRTISGLKRLQEWLRDVLELNRASESTSEGEKIVERALLDYAVTGFYNAPKLEKKAERYKWIWEAIGELRRDRAWFEQVTDRGDAAQPLVALIARADQASAVLTNRTMRELDLKLEGQFKTFEDAALSCGQSTLRDAVEMRSRLQVLADHRREQRQQAQLVLARREREMAEAALKSEAFRIDGVRPVRDRDGDGDGDSERSVAKYRDAGASDEDLQPFLSLEPGRVWMQDEMMRPLRQAWNLAGKYKRSRCLPSAGIWSTSRGDLGIDVGQMCFDRLPIDELKAALSDMVIFRPVEVAFAKLTPPTLANVDEIHAGQTFLALLTEDLEKMQSDYDRLDTDGSSPLWIGDDVNGDMADATNTLEPVANDLITQAISATESAHRARFAACCAILCHGFVRTMAMVKREAALYCADFVKAKLALSVADFGDIDSIVCVTSATCANISLSAMSKEMESILVEVIARQGLINKVIRDERATV